MKNIIHKITRLLSKFNVDNKISNRVIEERVTDILKEFREEILKEVKMIINQQKEKN